MQILQKRTKESNIPHRIAYESTLKNCFAHNVPVYIATELDEHGYNVIKFIGKGGFSKCYLVSSRKYKQLFACKVIQIPDADAFNRQKYIENEINILSQIYHKNIIKVFQVFQGKAHIYMILDYCSKGDLENYIDTHGKISNEDQFLKIASMMLEPLVFLEG